MTSQESIEEWKAKAWVLLGKGMTRKEVAWTLTQEGYKTLRGLEITQHSIAVLIDHDRMKRRKREYFERIGAI